MSYQSKRALRRHHYRRLQRKRAGYWGGYASFPGRAQGQVVTSPCMCSGPCCGNPRYHFGDLTLQERRQADREQEMPAASLP